MEPYNVAFLSAVAHTTVARAGRAKVAKDCTNRTLWEAGHARRPRCVTSGDVRKHRRRGLLTTRVIAISSPAANRKWRNHVDIPQISRLTRRRRVVERQAA